jgi:hypothetical protein
MLRTRDQVSIGYWGLPGGGIQVTWVVLHLKSFNFYFCLEFEHKKTTIEDDNNPKMTTIQSLQPERAWLVNIHSLLVGG